MSIKITIMVFIIMILLCAVYGFYVKSKNIEESLEREKSAAYLDGFTDGVIEDEDEDEDEEE